LPKREDEYWRQNYYGGHPPACTCVKCTEKRLSGINTARHAEKYWLFILAIVVAITAGWMVYLITSNVIGATSGALLVAVNLGVFIWAWANFKWQWIKPHAMILSMVVIILTVITTLVAW